MTDVKTCDVPSCFFEPARASRLCSAHVHRWGLSPERHRSVSGPGGAHAETMLADFVRRMEMDGHALPGLKNIVDIQPTQKLPPVVMVKSKYMPEGH